MATNGRDKSVDLDDEQGAFDEPDLERLACQITGEAMRRLKAECTRRRRAEAAYVPYGKVVSEALVAILAPVPAKDIPKITAALAGRARPKRNRLRATG